LPQQWGTPGPKIIITDTTLLASFFFKKIVCQDVRTVDICKIPSEKKKKKQWGTPGSNKKKNEDETPCFGEQEIESFTSSTEVMMMDTPSRVPSLTHAIYLRRNVMLLWLLQSDYFPACSFV
jgi:hypothetical protein